MNPDEPPDLDPTGGFNDTCDQLPPPFDDDEVPPKVTPPEDVAPPTGGFQGGSPPSAPGAHAEEGDGAAEDLFPDDVDPVTIPGGNDD